MSQLEFIKTECTKLRQLGANWHPPTSPRDNGKYWGTEIPPELINQTEELLTALVTAMPEVTITRIGGDPCDVESTIEVELRVDSQGFYMWTSYSNPREFQIEHVPTTTFNTDGFYQEEWSLEDLPAIMEYLKTQ